MIPLHTATPPLSYPSFLPLLSPPARQLLDEIPHRDSTFSWNALISKTLLQNPNSSLRTFSLMLHLGSSPDRHTFPRAISAARLAGDLPIGRQIHARVAKLGLLSDDYVLSSLISLYGALDSSLSAQNLLSSSSSLNPVHWTLLIQLHSQRENPNLALETFHLMVSCGVSPDSVSIAAALDASRLLGSSLEGKKLHKMARSFGLESNSLVANSLTKMYVSCDLLHLARDVFDEMPARDLHLWTTMISGTVKAGGFNEGLRLFREFCHSGGKPDVFVLSSVLPACARLAGGKHGMEIHAHVIRHLMNDDDDDDDGCYCTIMGNALTDMYIKSGQFRSALKVFSMIDAKDLVSWTSIIMGYSLYGIGEIGVKIFNHMMMDPDDAAYYAVLHACSTSCMVEHGRMFFRKIRNPKFEHKIVYAGLLARGGEFSEAVSFMEKQEMKIRIEMIKVIIDGCRIHGNMHLGKKMVEHLLEIDPLNADNYVMMGNVYACEGRWGMVDEVREMMKDLGLKARKACSWIEVMGKIHVFSVGDVSHPRSVMIRWEMERLMEKVGPMDDDYSLHDVDEERESICGGHSEMLAIVFGMASIRGVIRVAKNARISQISHEFAKRISIMEEREILLKDPFRFHRFKHGECSCKDMW